MIKIVKNRNQVKSIKGKYIFKGTFTKVDIYKRTKNMYAPICIKTIFDYIICHKTKNRYRMK